MKLLLLKVLFVILPFLRGLFLVRAIRWSGLKKCKTEREAEERLFKKLRFLGYRPLRQVVRRTRSGIQRADILIGKTPIELKYNPTGPETDRLVGQLLRYKKEWGRAIAVIVKGRKETENRIKAYAKGVKVVMT